MQGDPREAMRIPFYYLLFRSNLGLCVKILSVAFRLKRSFGLLFPQKPAPLTLNQQNQH